VAWILTTDSCFGRHGYICGHGVIPGNPIDSHRAECFGILGGISTWQQYKSLWSINPNTNITIMCDDQSAINYACNTIRYRYISSKIPDFDVLGTIRFLLKEERYQFQHLKGHQDRESNNLIQKRG
jgi:hypothetical protein